MPLSWKQNLVHEKRFDYGCEYCGKKYVTLPLLQSHLTQTHTRNVLCDICSKKICNKRELRRHKVNVHKHKQTRF